MIPAQLSDISRDMFTGIRPAQDQFHRNNCSQGFQVPIPPKCGKSEIPPSRLMD